MFIHLADERSTWQHTILALQVARLSALLLGAVAVWATYRIGREVFPGAAAIALVAASIVAFLPQFLFISSSASNDSTAAAMCALSLWATVRIIRHGWTARRAICLGIALALAALSKVSALMLIPWALVASAVSTFPIKGYKSTFWRKQVPLIALTLGIALLIAGPWYLRSYLIFGDALGITPHLAMPWARPEAAGVDVALQAMPLTVVSFWMAFGWGTISTARSVYIILNSVAGVCLLFTGLHIFKCRNHAERWGLILLGGWVVLILIGLIRWNQIVGAPLGRLAFPAIAAIAVLLAVGWVNLVSQDFVRRWLSPRSGAWLVALLPAGLFALSIYALPALLQPAFAGPAMLTEAQVSQQPGYQVDIQYGNVARLLRVAVPRNDWPKPGEAPAVHLCWEALQRDPRDLRVLIQLVDVENRVVATRRTPPGLGAFSTGTWSPDIRFCDDVHARIKPWAHAPAVVRVEVGIIDQATGERLPAFAPDGSPLDTDFVGETKLAPGAYPVPIIEQPLAVRLDDQIDLIGYDAQPATLRPGDSIRLRSDWRAVRRPAADYTLFVHLRDAAGKTIAQADGEPQSGDYPTSFWDPGEVVSDERLIEIPPGTSAGAYQVVMGLYHLATGERLPVNGGPGTEITLPITVTVP